MVTRNSAVTQVTWHNKMPQFFDEIKMKLPTKLHAKHHLLFKFYHVACQQPKKGEDELEVPVGWSVLPLYEGHKYKL